jgi:hypothetical protein
VSREQELKLLINVNALPCLALPMRRSKLQEQGVDVDSLLTQQNNDPMVQADVQRLVRTHWVEVQPFDRRNIPRGQHLEVPTATAQRDNITLTATGQTMQVAVPDIKQWQLESTWHVTQSVCLSQALLCTNHAHTRSAESRLWAQAVGNHIPKPAIGPEIIGGRVRADYGPGAAPARSA